jgi:hypothetical protein
MVYMEPLEHVVELDVVIERVRRLLAAQGRLVVSVRVETGPLGPHHATQAYFVAWKKKQA